MSPKTALVTGCSQGGIGYSLAAALADAGWQVVGTVRAYGKEGDLQEKGVKIIIMDIDSQDSIRKAKDAFLEISPTVDLLINNAGLGGKEALLEVSLDEIESRFRTNVFGLLLCCQVFGQLMAQRGSGTIVNVGSVAGIASVPWMGLYGATKAAVRSLTTTLAYEVEPLGLRVVHLAPALVHTPFSSKTGDFNYTGTVYEPESIKASNKATDVMVDTGNGRGMNPMDFAKAVIAQITLPRPPPEVIIGTDSWIFRYLNPYVPTWIWRSMIMRDCGANGLRRAGSQAK